jgi:hypothetical protein
MLFETSFEGVKLGSKPSVIPGIRDNGRNFPSISNDFARTGTQCMKTVFDPATSIADPNRPPGNFYHIEAISTITETDSKFNVDYWYKFSILLHPSHTADATAGANYEAVCQWQTQVKCGARNKPMGVGLLAHGGKWRVVHAPGWCGGPGQKTYVLDSWVTGKWYDFLFHIRWSSTANGILKVWFDGVSKISLENVITTDAAAKAPRFKWGIYHQAATKKLIVYHDDVRISDQAQAPGGGGTSGGGTGGGGTPGGGANDGGCV